MDQTFECILLTPEAQLLDQPVVYASLPAWDGLLGVAPMRAPLMVKLGDGPLRLDTNDSQSQWFFVGGGFAQMRDNKLIILADQAIAADKIDPAVARADVSGPGAEPAITDAQVAARDRRQNRAKHLARIAELAD